MVDAIAAGLARDLLVFAQGGWPKIRALTPSVPAVVSLH